MRPRSNLPVDIYVRVSRRAGRSDERFHSPEEQETIARSYLGTHNLKEGVVLTPDIDRSGGTVEREGLRQALARVRAGESQGFVVAWLDRFSRDAPQAYDLLREIEDAGGRVYAPEAPEDVSSPEGELQLGMFLLIAQYQRKRAKAGFERAKERAIRAGIPVGPIPLGLRAKEDRTLEPDPEHRGTIRELFERRSRGDGYSALADFLEERTGRAWTRQGVSRILANRIYATGRLEYNGILSDEEHAFEPLVDEPLWHAAQRIAPRPRKARSRDSGWLLTGLARCARCGNALAPWTGAKRRRQDPRRGKMNWVDVPNVPRRYRCVNRSCEERASVDADRLEKWVTLRSFELGDELATRSEAPDLGALEEAVARTSRRLDQVMAPEARDALGELWAADVKARRTERDDALARLGEARQDAGVPAHEFRLRDVWDDLKTEDRRSALSLFWKAIRVGRRTDGGIPITFVARGPHGETEVELQND